MAALVPADVRPVDFASPVGQVRGLIPDVELLSNPNHPDDDDGYLFSDSHLAMLLTVSNNQPLLAAAQACDILGTSETLIAKSITTQDLTTDGPGLMKAFLSRGAQLRAEALRLDNQEDFDIVPSLFLWQPFYPQTEESQMLGDPTYGGSYRPIWP